MLRKFRIEIRNAIGKKYAIEAAETNFQDFFEAFFRLLKQAYPTDILKRAIKTDLPLALRELDIDYLGAE